MAKKSEKAREGGARSRAERRREQMARRKAERREPGATTPRQRPLPDWALLVPALGGVLLAGYLSLVAWLGTTPVACGSGSACDLVQSSRFAEVLGLPVAAWGLAAYAVLAGVAWGVRSARWHALLALAVAAPGLALSVYLTAVSLFVIGATCLWCLASLVLMGACFVAAVRALPPPLRTAPYPLATVALLALVAVGGLHLLFQGRMGPAAGPEDPYLRALAQHLAESGAVFYGASWCPHCTDQKAYFESSAHRLPYVECAPAGRRGPQAEACREAGITTYPTWIVDGQRYEGIMPPHRLARISDFDGEGEGAGS